MSDILDWLFRRGTSDESNDEPTTQTLHRVKWDETHTKTYTDVTERLTWAAGAEKEVTYTKDCTEEWCGDYFIRDRETRDVDRVIYCKNAPEITEILGEEDWSVEETETHYAWVSEVPPGVEETGKTGEVIRHE